MLKLIQDLQQINEHKEQVSAAIIVETADKYLGQIYAKLGNKHRTLKQQDINTTDLAKVLTGFRVIGKSDLRSGFSDVSKPNILLKLLNDIAEVGQTKEFGEDLNHKVIADERLKQIGETSPSMLAKYEELLKQLEEDETDDQARETLLRDINKMRTFFEQIRGKLKLHLDQKHNDSIKRSVPSMQ